MRKSKAMLLLPILALLAVIGGAVLSLALGDKDKDAGLSDIESSVAFLRQLEAGDPELVMKTIRRQERARMEAERDEMRDKLVNGEIDVWSQFRDYVILGDSRASGFSYYSWLPGEYVLAEPGDTIWKIEDHLETVKSLAPARAFIAYGANDLDYWSEPEDFARELAKMIAELEEAVPGIEIYVSSILRVQDWVSRASLQNIPAYNDAVRAMCAREGYVYIDNDSLTAEHQDLYEGDGVHFKSVFYPYWGANFILATYYGDIGAEDTAA